MSEHENVESQIGNDVIPNENFQVPLSNQVKHLIDSPSPSLDSNDSGHGQDDVGSEHDSYKCSAVHTFERDMPDFDYSHLVRELRERILKECQENPGTYGQLDIDKCKTDDWFISRYLLRQKLDVDLAFDMLKKSMRFKHENLANFIRAEDFPAEFYQVAGLFGYEPDRKGNKMLYIRVKIHRKIPEITSVLQAYLFHNIIKLDEEANGKGISVVIDCSGGGIANADMDMLLFLVSTLSNYFPKGLSYFLVHELPWVLKPFWYIARTWLPEEHRQLIKFSDASNIFEYIDRENLPDFMGGTCKRPYNQPPENCTTLEQAAKLWGIEQKVVKRVLHKFADYLPEETMRKIDGLSDNEEEEEEEGEKNN